MDTLTLYSDDFFVFFQSDFLVINREHYIIALFVIFHRFECFLEHKI